MKRKGINVICRENVAATKNMHAIRVKRKRIRVKGIERIIHRENVAGTKNMHPTNEKIWNGTMLGGGTKWWNRNVTERDLYLFI